MKPTSKRLWFFYKTLGLSKLMNLGVKKLRNLRHLRVEPVARVQVLLGCYAIQADKYLPMFEGL